MKTKIFAGLLFSLLTLVACVSPNRSFEVEMDGNYELEWSYQTLDPDKQMELDQQFLLKSQRKSN